MLIDLSSYRVFLGFAAIALCVLWGHDALAEATGTIRGVVTDKKTGQPLPFVNVVVKGTNTGASTGEDGSYEIKNLSPGVYAIIVTLVGHETQQISGLEVTEGKVSTRDVLLVDTAVEIGDVTVYGASLRGERITEAPSAVSVLSAREIKLASVNGQVPRLLETQPGVDIVQSGLNDFNVNVRGFNSSLNRRLLVLLDGRDLAVAFLGSQEWNGLSLPVEDLGRMELIRGPGSALYGANAFNGVINIVSARPADIAGTKVTVAGGEKSSLRTDVRHAAVSERWSYKMNIGRFQGDSWCVSRLSFPFEYDGLNPFLNTEVVPIKSGKISSTYGSARLDYEVEVGSRATLEGGMTNVRNELLVTGIGRIQVPNANKPWGRVSYSSDHLYAQLWVAGRNSIDPQVSLSTGLPLKEKSLLGQVDVQYRFSALEDRLFVVTGAAHKYQSVGTEGTLTLAEHHDNLSGLYAQLEYTFSREFKSIAAARWDRSTLHASQFSPKLAAVWSPNLNHSIRATFNKAFQAPNYSELFLYVKHPVRSLAYFGNDELVVERITGYEVGYKGIFSQALFITLDGYYNQLSDFITDLAPAVNPRYPGQVLLPGETAPRTIWSYGNAGRVSEFGFEVGANYYAADNIEVTANYALFDFEIKAQNQNDVLLPNAPKHKVNAGVTYRAETYEVNASMKYVPSFDWAAGIFKGRINSYALVNLNGSVDLTPNLQLGLSVSNLFDKRHYEIFGGSLLGRRAIASLTATF